MEKEILSVHMRRCVSVYVWDDKKPKAFKKKHAWTAVFLGKKRTKEMRFKKRRKLGSLITMKQREGRRKGLKRRLTGRKSIKRKRKENNKGTIIDRKSKN